jgi:hypothetical protein
MCFNFENNFYLTFVQTHFIASNMSLTHHLKRLDRINMKTPNHASKFSFTRDFYFHVIVGV